MASRTTRLYTLATLLMSGLVVGVACNIGAFAPNAGCEFDGDASAGVQGSLLRQSGNGRTAQVGSQIVVEALLRDIHDHFLCESTISWTPGPNSGSVNPGQSITGDSSFVDGGIAGTVWTLGPVAGTQTLTATVDNSVPPLSVVFTATASPAGLHHLAIVSGDQQSTPSGTALPQPVIVKLVDGSGLPAPATTLDWQVSGGGALLHTTTTSATGRSSNTWFLGWAGVAQTVSVTDPAGSSVVFTAASTPSAYRLVIVSGDDQTAPFGTTLPQPLVVGFLDSLGRPGLTTLVNWTAAGAGNGTVAQATTTTDPTTGLSQINFTLGSGVTQRVDASTFLSGPFADLQVFFTVTGTTPTAESQLAITSGDQQMALGGSVLQPLVVQWADENGNPGPATVLTWDVEGGGSLAQSTTTTNGTSKLFSNTWTLGTAGSQSVTVSEPGGSSVMFTATILGTGVSCSGGTTHAPLSGNITADETWTLAQSPHHVPGDIHFDNATLTIEPGATVCSGLVAGLTFQNGGRLIANGTATEPIVFTAASTVVRGWDGLNLQPNNTGASSLRNVIIQYADRGMLVLGHPVVMDSIIVRQSKGAALDLRGAGIEVLRSRVDTTLTPATAAVIMNSPDTRFESTVRGAAGIGIDEANASGLNLVNCEVFGSGSHGVRLAIGTVSNCNLSGNGGDGIASISGLPITAQGNWWGDPAGPNGPVGDGVSGNNVDFSNFLTAPAVVGPRP